ncbi:hypothetical protein [Brevibacillus thermoruber]|jgi:hypothetical protein|uniref:Uncharacterized protein n=1 Tax=Brevibacillus thermoruber TaxID=33942 RepID=A0A9X3Z1U2_9BACL|nr:hypothetical protein [Brevibacillus thermoruber]MDA5107071.1 hypothetical protein [Brevibacillus thermoruber]
MKHLERMIVGAALVVSRNADNKIMVGKKWEDFLHAFFSLVKRSGKESKLNLLSFVSVTKLFR